MTTQPNSPGSGPYAPLAMVALWGVHGLISWYLSRDLPTVALGVGILVVSTVLTQFFYKPQGLRAMVWRPGLMTRIIVICWLFWAVLHALWNLETYFAMIWPTVAYIASYSDQSPAGKRRRRAQDIGV